MRLFPLTNRRHALTIPRARSYLVHATDATAELSDYANSDADIKEDDDEKANNDGYMATPPSPVQRRPFETAYRNFGEAALDSEDEPQTQSDDDADRVAQLHRVDSDDEGEKPAFPGGFESYFPRRGAMPAEVNAVNHDVSRLELESALSHAGTDDLGAAGVDDLKLESNALDDAQVGVGAGGSQTAHDPAFLFRPLVAYFDTREGAQTNGLTASSKPDRIQARADSEYASPLASSALLALSLTRLCAIQARQGAHWCVALFRRTRVSLAS